MREGKISVAMVIWITGLSGAGKTTLATKVVDQLRTANKKVIFLDGDQLRDVFYEHDVPAKVFSRPSRLKLAFRYSLMCKLLASQDFCVVIATISLFEEIHAWNRSNLPGYFEVYLKVPLSELKKRDPKGIYKRFFDGEISNVAGLDLEVDDPQNPDYIIDHQAFNPRKDHFNQLMDMIFERLNA